MADYFTSQNGRLWVQTAPGASPQYLGCHTTGDLSEPEGGITNRYCPSPTDRGKYQLVGQSQDPPDAKGFSVEGRIGKEVTYLERYSDCPLTFYVVQSECDDPRDFTAFERVVVVEDCRRTSMSESNLASRDSDDESLQSLEFAPDAVQRIYPYTVARQTIADTNDALDIVFANRRQCASACGNELSACQIGMVVCAAGAGVTANAYYTANGGATWGVTATDPFAVDEDISSACAFPMGRAAYRFIVGRGTTDAGNLAEVAYTDDNGATWTTVNLPTANGDFLPWGNCLWALDRYHVWAVTDDGDVYFSDDGGLTWTEQASANANSLNAIHMMDEAYGVFGGDTNTIYMTTNGGDTWTALTGPAAQAAVDVLAVFMTDQHTIYAGYADGDIYLTTDAGTTWTRLDNAITGATVNRVNDIKMVDRYVGWAAVKYTVGADIFGGIMRTYDGGNSWQNDGTVELDVGALGLSAIWECSANKAVAAGDIATTATVYVASD